MVRYGTLKANAGRVGTHNIFELEQLKREGKSGKSGVTEFDAIHRGWEFGEVS